MGEHMTITEQSGPRTDRADTLTTRPVTNCRCGQELDVCARTQAQCPRCGSNLPR